MVNRLRSEQGTRPYWRNEGEIGLGNRAPVTILVALAVCAALLFHLGAAIWAQTNRDFDNAGTPFAVDQLSTPPNNPPREVPSGTTGKFLRLAGAPTPNSNTVTFDRTDAGVFPLIVADFD